MDADAWWWFFAGMNLPLSPRIRATGAPPIPAVRGWAARYQGGAGPVLDLTQAVPGYPPHPDLLARLAAAAGDAKAAGYGPIEGETALREALAADMAGMTVDLNGEPNNPPAIIDIPDESVTAPPPPPEPPQGAPQSL